MKVLVTGGAGYVGGVSVDALLGAGHAVVVLDDLSTGHPAIVPVRCPAGTRLVRRRGCGPGAAGGRGGRRHPPLRGTVTGRRERRRSGAGTTATTSPGGIALLEAARASGVRRVVFSSTAAVYGVPMATPIREDAPLRPINPYGETKRTFEGALRWYGAAYGLRSVILRYFNVAGATDRLGEVHRPETHLIPNALHRGRGWSSAHAVRRRLPDARRDADPRLHPRRRSCRRARRRARSTRTRRSRSL